MLRKELRQRLVEEYRYAVTKMQQTPEPAKKLFYFSVFYGEAQRILNFEWDADLALIYTITQHVHKQLSAQSVVAQLPIEWGTVYVRLTQAASDLTDYFDNPEYKDSREKLCIILGFFAEIAYAVSGNGSYLYEKGAFKF